MLALELSPGHKISLLLITIGGGNVPVAVCYKTTELACSLQGYELSAVAGLFLLPNYLNSA